ncbi:hypothetical protein GCM10011531_18770 [Aquaticitalea lipolytica]|uniref:Uncharacterized protein n=1 Tax=Aquaticitalea lipolytica TaxID=1247562 RepID=A0A8J2TQ77_9FLAO|nr:hypothetical protein [Aquaticitalea lipolytica]GFZ87542.1 hypothetical protein GCM10011531_18770 [Aquaticitalea lipolytica]
MQKFYLVLVLVLTFSCTQTDNRITEFEKVLGERQTNALNLLVSDFEINLTKIYPNLTTEKGYRQYLNDMISDTISYYENYSFMSRKTITEYIESGLWNEVYETNYYFDINSKDSIETISVNNIGKYMQALYVVKDSDNLINKYWEKREAAGMMQNELVVNGILSSNPDFNDYFHKRIVVLEFSF